MNAVDLWIWPIDTASDADWQVLDPAERDRAGRFLHDRHRHAFIRAHAGMRAALGRHLGLPPAALAFEAGPYGKPRLALPGPHFSLSHSGNLAALAVSAEHDLGLDIEVIRPIEAMTLAAHFFSAEECDALARLPPAWRQRGFFNAWTRKEAFLKAIGLGLTVPLADFSVSLAPGEPARLRSIAWDTEEAARWHLASLRPAPGVIGAIAIRATGWTIRSRDPRDTMPESAATPRQSPPTGQAHPS